MAKAGEYLNSRQTKGGSRLMLIRIMYSSANRTPTHTPQFIERNPVSCGWQGLELPMEIISPYELPGASYCCALDCVNYQQAFAQASARADREQA